MKKSKIWEYKKKRRDEEYDKNDKTRNAKLRI